MKEELLKVEECCSYYHIEYNFLELLQEHSLIEIITINEQHFLYTEALSDLEVLLRMHYDLGINLEGIEVINNLLSRVKNMQQQIANMKNKLKIYED